MAMVIRDAVADRLVALFTTALAAESVTVVTDLRSQDPREWVSIDAAEGTLTIPHMRPSSAGLTVDDEWTQDVLVSTNVPGRTMSQARARAVAIASILVSTVTGDPSLATPSAITGLLWCTPSAFKGPDLLSVDEGTGWAARVVLTLSCRSRLIHS